MKKPSRFRPYPPFLRITSVVVLFFFTWICIEPWNYAVWAQSTGGKAPQAAAKPESAAGKFEASLRETQKAIDNLDLALEKGLALPDSDVQALKTHKKALEAADPEIRAEFAATQAFLKEKNLPAVIFERHAKAVADYDQNYKQLKGNLDAILSLEADRKRAEGKNDQKTAEGKQKELKAKIKAAKTHLAEKVKKPRHQPLDPNNLPHRTAKPTKQKPRMTKEAFLRDFGVEEAGKVVPVSYNGKAIPGAQFASHPPNPDVPTAADLAETIEVQFTPEIQAKAAELEHNPVKIYNWVHNNIDFVPTYGSIQGANHCLLTKQCNDMDTASLLIALLRTSGIPARYVMGTIEVPMDQVMNWVGGFTDPAAALGFIASGGTPVQAVTSAGKFKAARMEHMWVEAYVDYEPSRGAVNKVGKRWVPVDASFKRYEAISADPAASQVHFNAEQFIVELQASASINETESNATSFDVSLVQSLLGNYLAEVRNHIIGTLPNINSMTLLGGRLIEVLDPQFFIGLMPYEVVAEGNSFSEIQDTFRYKAILSLLPASGSQIDFSVTKPLPEVAASRITVSYSPDSSSDEAYLISQIDSPSGSLQSFLVKLKPEIKIDGEIVATGQPVQMGKTQRLKITIIPPTLSQSIVENNVTAGTTNVLVLNVSSVFPDQIDERRERLRILKDEVDSGDYSRLSKDEIIGEFLYGIGVSYWGLVDLVNNLSSRQTAVVQMRLPSFGMFTHDVDVTTIFQTPFSITPFGFGTDIDLDLSVVFAADADQQAPINFMAQTGLMASAMEAMVYDLAFNNDFTGKGISTAHILEYANRQGIPIYSMDNSNINTVLPALGLPNDILDDVTNAVAAGNVVVIPEDNITKDGWTGIGYLVFDRQTGSGSYLISGGLAGGGYTCDCFSLSKTTELVVGLVVLSTSLNAGVAVFGAAAGVILSIMQAAGKHCEISNRKDLTKDQKDVLIAMTYFNLAIGLVASGVAFYYGGPSAAAIVVGLYILYQNLMMSLIQDNMGAFFRGINQQGAMYFEGRTYHVA